MSMVVAGKAQVLFSPDGRQWDGGKPIGWEPDPAVTKVVLGSLDGDKPIAIDLPANLAARFPNLTHLHLWTISGLKGIPELPVGLRCLDIRRCESLQSLPVVPPDIDTLVIEKAPELAEIPHGGLLAQLQDLSLAGCSRLSDEAIHGLLARAPALEQLNLSGCSIHRIASHPGWPSKLIDIRLDDCRRLKFLPRTWPESLRRIGLRSAEMIASLTDLPSPVDYVDLAHTRALENLPLHGANHARPRTLFVFGSGLPLAPELFGDNDDTNVAPAVLADLDATARGMAPDHEIKVILLGNGRCGKSSLVRRWKENEFNPREPSTHGIRLWSKTMEFKPEDGSRTEAQLHIWDFAGQDLYHSTHRIFLQSRALFILCHTDHPYGADAATDEDERAALEQEGDNPEFDRRYWLDQIDSLGKVPGLDISPPVLIVRTKVDRDGEAGSPRAVTADSEVRFSARTGAGLGEIEDWVEEQVRKLLGKQEMRSLPAEAMAVKQELLPWIEENERVHEENEKHWRKTASPHPSMPLSRFKEIVERLCRGDYRAKPELLLDRFHRNGFVYYSRDYLPDHVILDQRWVIEGIYAFASRQSDFNLREWLLKRQGRFSAEDVAKLSWQRAGYDPDAQRLFLGFMRQCGMCFELLTRDETVSGHALYAAPAFFPERESVVKQGDWERMARKARRAISLERAAEAEVRFLLSRLGNAWSRSMEAWRWGCRLIAAESEAVCLIDWPRNKGEYFAPLKIWFSGKKDPQFEDYVRERVRESLHDPAYSEPSALERAWPKPEVREWKEPRKGVAEVAQKQPAGERHTAIGVRIGISYAGPTADAPLLAGIPRAMKKRFKPEEVQEYATDTETDLGRMMTNLTDLARQDLVLCFLSPKYLHSPYCMTELLRLYDREHGFRHGLVQFYLFPGTGLENRLIEWEQFWSAASQRRQAEAEAKHPDWNERNTYLAREPAHDWYEFVKIPARRSLFAERLVHYRFYERIRLPQTEAEAESEADRLLPDLRAKLENPDLLEAHIEKAWEEGRIDRSVHLYCRLETLRPDLRDPVEARKHSAVLGDVQRKARELGL